MDFIFALMISKSLGDTLNQMNQISLFLCCLAAQSVCVQRVCTGAQPARVTAGPAVRALPPRISLSHPPVRELPLPRSYHKVGVSTQRCRQQIGSGKVGIKDGGVRFCLF